LVDDHPDVNNMCQSGHFVHPPVILDGKTVTCNTNSVPKIPPTPSSPTNPHKANTSRPFWDLGSFILSSPTPKHTEKLQKLGFQKLLPVQRIFLPMMQLSDCFFRVVFFKEWDNIYSEATMLLREFDLCVNHLHRTKFQ